ncbi:MAG: MerR family transcriptional regulator [Rhodobacteraceae bacterium]|nr:MerR family transcriptional regulator [Paracoccaceae bacterium]
MQNDQKTIREMCDLFDVTPRTLRFYEAKELIAPIRDGQKRLYTKRDRARLKLILRGKKFGFSLEEIRQLLEMYYMQDQQQTQMTKTYELAQVRFQRHEYLSKSSRIEVINATLQRTHQGYAIRIK